MEGYNPIVKTLRNFIKTFRNPCFYSFHFSLSFFFFIAIATSQLLYGGKTDMSRPPCLAPSGAPPSRSCRVSVSPWWRRMAPPCSTMSLSRAGTSSPRPTSNGISTLCLCAQVCVYGVAVPLDKGQLSLIERLSSSQR